MTKKNLAKAVLNVMKEADNIEKNMRVGSANYGYDGVKDLDVKKKFQSLFIKNNLVILPIDVVEESQVDRWEETASNGMVKSKQQVFTKVVCNYLLIHTESGEEQVVTGLGHGVDPQDKAAGKATTYALKNLLMYMFLTPVGDIDDTDTIHSGNHPVAPKAVTAVRR